jgi:hypothetical protein
LFVDPPLGLDAHTKTHGVDFKGFSCTFEGCTSSYQSKGALAKHTKTYDVHLVEAKDQPVAVANGELSFVSGMHNEVQVQLLQEAIRKKMEEPEDKTSSPPPPWA